MKEYPMNHPESSLKKTRLSQPGAAAARAIGALNERKRTEAERREKYKSELAELERLAAAELSRLRKIQREDLRKQESRVALRIGRDVLVQMRRKGVAGALLTDALSAWQSTDLAELNGLLSAEGDPESGMKDMDLKCEASGQSDSEIRLD